MSSTPERETVAGKSGQFTRRQALTTGAAAVLGLVGPSAIAAEDTQTKKPGRVANSVALITGAARGIGRATALTLAREGADIIAIDIARDVPTVAYPMARADDLASLEREVRKLGRRIVQAQADVRDLPKLREIVTRGVDELGKIDICVANAGIASFARLDEMTDEHWHTTIGVNLNGAVNTLRAVIPHMISRKQGRIIVMSSEGGRRGTGPGLSAYGAAKWGLIGVAKTAAQELSQHLITVNAICPGSVRTGMTNNEAFYRLARPDLPQPNADDQAAVVLKMNVSANKLPIAWIEPEDIANAVLFLASAEGRYVTGAAIDVTAGTSATYTA